MDPLLLLEQAFNGLQFGVMLFLIAAGLTLVFGIMDLVNLAHGSLVMIGAYLATTLIAWTDSFIFGIALALPATFAVGVLVEVVALRTLYRRNHLDQVLATFGLILFFNEVVRIIWGAQSIYSGLPDYLSGQVEIIPGAPYPVFRLVIIAVGLIVAALIYTIVAHTRLGMLIRAGASNNEMVGALGINIKSLFTFVFALGAVFAGLAGMMLGPLTSVEPGIGEPLLILAFVVIIIGGIGSIRGAFIAAILIGMADTVGRVFLPVLLRIFVSDAAADTAGPALASMLIYILMAAILVVRPRGLFPARTG
ncbi:MAG: branched-chain amino acid ABC transporter permease [Rhodospirillaceae bacterium]|jgi:branched-chain amino acid transport system permease protein|nr:branched-chain amino acid ABC transporter permease [Rhodospirillaceae bacterium]MBT4043923.1 branched-chain amino acid ABC transporter permease [Rhodospirillaceae bacterium]MBT4691452.1 branched-chain amino acid ABC transporter permease [Rhodospirillaceae bacterium]MBT5082955.1 branched-chain amino acid ABC transporter permease [Rhodospirillaceae bacterium]MBT5524399.1 branched-chain amino acid ABC transporter permease [Rhodospirillaceae bacterium]